MIETKYQFCNINRSLRMQKQTQEQTGNITNNNKKEKPTHNNAKKFSWYTSFSFITIHLFFDKN